MKTFDENMSNDEKKELLENSKCHSAYGNMTFIGLDDTFDFQCQRCGSCCMNRGDIILNSFDVYRASKQLGITPDEFLEKYAVLTLGGMSKIPMVLLGQQENGMCHFLDFDYCTGLFRCTINDNKPGACANHPIGLVSRYSATDKDADADYAFIKVDQCENSKKPVPQKVRDWVKSYLDNKEEVDMAHSFVSKYNEHFNFRKLYFITQFLHQLAVKNADRLTQEDPMLKAFSSLSSGVIYHTYGNYDINKPYIPQAEENLSQLEGLLTSTDKIFKASEEACNSLFEGQGMDVDSIIAANDADDGANVDIAKLAIMLANNTTFKKEDEE